MGFLEGVRGNSVPEKRFPLWSPLGVRGGPEAVGSEMLVELLEADGVLVRGAAVDPVLALARHAFHSASADNRPYPLLCLFRAR